MVSIIIVSYNSKQFIIKCLDSIKKYASVDTETIVVDNNSTDGSVKLIQSSKFKVQNGNLKLKIIENKENLGYAKAVNQGIKASHGEYIFVLNPDTELTKGSINALLDFTLLHKDVIVGPRLLNPDGSVQASCYHEPTLWAAFQEYFLGIKGTFEKYTPKVSRATRVDAVVGAAMFIPRKTIEKVGFFNERFFMYFEDLDFCRRVRSSGLSVYYLPTARIYHEHGGVTQTVPQQAREWLVESSKIYHGVLRYTLLSIILWLGQKWRKLLVGKTQ